MLNTDSVRPSRRCREHAERVEDARADGQERGRFDVATGTDDHQHADEADDHGTPGIARDVFTEQRSRQQKHHEWRPERDPRSRLRVAVLRAR